GLRLAAELADGSMSLGDGGASMEDSILALRDRNAWLDECCTEIGRDPTTLEHAYFAGFAEEFPFASPAALDDFVGRYREARGGRLVFIFGDEPGGGRYATRESLSEFASSSLERLVAT